MNRQQRRIQQRQACRITREALRDHKHSHRLIPQSCVLYVPAARMYVAELALGKARLVEHIELARQYVEDEASAAALTFREITGEPVAVRRCYATGITCQFCGAPQLSDAPC